MATPSLVLLDPIGWAAFRKLKTGSDRNLSLLGAGSTDAQAMLLSLPVIGPLQVATSDQRDFDSDGIGVRATWRLGHAVVRPERIGVFSIGGGGS